MRKRFWRATLELTALMGLSISSYYAAAEANAVDWDYPVAWSTLWFKLTSIDAWRLDDNAMWLNSPGHQIAGAYFYLFARSNNFGKFESFLFGLFVSYFWEIVAEFQEVVSINDMLMTPIGGFAIGEALHQMGLFFLRGSNRWYKHVLAFLFDPTSTIHYWIDKQKVPQSDELTRFGFPKEPWHRFVLFAGSGLHFEPRTHLPHSGLDVGFHTQLMGFPGYQRPRSSSYLTLETVWTEIFFLFHVGWRDSWDIDFYAKTVFLGYVQQKTFKRAGRLWGHVLWLGPMTGYQHWERRDGSFVDRMAVINIVGPHVDLTLFRGGAKIRMFAEMFGDFAAVHAYALPAYVTEHSLEGTRSVLRNQGYYYAFGLTLAARLEVEMDPLTLGSSFRYNWVDSIEGWDRFQKDVTQDFNLNDDRLQFQLWLMVAIPHTPLHAQLLFWFQTRRGIIEKVDSDGQELRLLLRLLLQL